MLGFRSNCIFGKRIGEKKTCHKDSGFGWTVFVTMRRIQWMVQRWIHRHGNRFGPAKRNAFINNIPIHIHIKQLLNIMFIARNKIQIHNQQHSKLLVTIYPQDWLPDNNIFVTTTYRYRSKCQWLGILCAYINQQSDEMLNNQQCKWV